MDGPERCAADKITKLPTMTLCKILPAFRQKKYVKTREYQGRHSNLRPFIDISHIQIQSSMQVLPVK